MWQVSEATIKRWADAGHLSSQKTLGGHRRFTLAEVLRFQTARGLEATRAKSGEKRSAAAAPGASGRLKPRAQLEHLFEAIAAGHETDAADALLKSHLDRIPTVRILEEIVARSLQRVGDLWHDGEMSVADEHLSTRTAIRAIETLRRAIRPTEVEDGPLAICCAAEEELHDVAALCVQVLLESEGWSVRNLGANTPFFALTDAVTKHRPRLVCVSSTSNVALARYSRDYAQFQTVARKLQTRIVLGGAGFMDATIRQRFPADLHAEDFVSLNKLIQSSS